MIDTAQPEQRVSRYLRDRMPAAEAERFELELLDSPELQDELEVQLAIRRALEYGSALDAPRDRTATKDSGAHTTWPHWAVAASICMAVVAGLMYLTAAKENSILQERVATFDALRSNVKVIPVDLMRSTGGSTPDIVIKRPAGKTLMALSVELNPDAAVQSTLNATLRTAEGEVVTAWTDSVVSNQRIVLGLDSADVASAQYRLEIRTKDSQPVDRRLLEFR